MKVQRTAVPFLAAALLAAALPALAAVPLFRTVSAEKSLRPAPENLVGTVPVMVDAAVIGGLVPGDVVEFALPNGRAYRMVTERVDRHADGDRSWVGYIEGWRTDMPVIVTMGPAGTYASFDTPDGRWGIVPGGGNDWLFDADMSQLYLERPAGTTDARVPPALLGPRAKADPVCSDVFSLPAPQATIDVLFVMAPDFVSIHGGAANASTRVNNLISSINTYYANSNIAMTLRRVAAINVGYASALSGTTDDSTALDQITNGLGVFNNVESLRTLYGADMVAFLRGPLSGGGISGVAWVGGYSTQPMSGSYQYMYSVNGDAPGFTGTLIAHELGHNMGNNHDHANAGTTVPGATSYAYGFTRCGTSPSATCPTTAGFNNTGTGGYGTIMSYWRPTTPKFSSPNYTCTSPTGGASTCGGTISWPAGPGGVGTADAVKSMNCVRQAIAAFRAPAVTDCANIAQDTDGDGLPNCVETALARSTAVKDNDIFAAGNTGALLFAMQQYRDFLGREADADGLNFYMTNLVLNAVPKSVVTEGFFNSAEFQNTGAAIVRLYSAFFNRIPDHAGFVFQTNALRTGQSLGSIANNFTLSPEFVATYGSLNNAQYVTLLYQNVLGRTPTQPEIDFHVNRLNTGTSRGEVMTGFSESPEYKALKANGVYAIMLYEGLLRRAADTGGFNFYVNLLNTGTPGTTLIANFQASTEYRGRFLP